MSWGFPGGSSGKEHAEHTHAGDMGGMDSIPGAGRSPEGEHGNPLQYPCLENLMERSLVGPSPYDPKELDTM